MKKHTAATLLFFAFSAAGLRAMDTNFAHNVVCETQTATAELADLIWLQGSTPLIAAQPRASGRPIAAGTNVTVRMLIAPNPTNSTWAVVTNTPGPNTAYWLQWPTIGTNTAGTAWWYTIFFESAGHRYWTGAGRLYIDTTTSTAADGLKWIEFVSDSRIEELAGDLNAHTENTENPHAVTPDQIGAASTGYVAAAVAPLATTQQLADAVAPLATTGYVAAAVAPLASTQQLAGPDGRCWRLKIKYLSGQPVHYWEEIQ